MSPRDPFDLPPRLSAKLAPELIGGDREHFAALDACLRERAAALRDRIDELRGMAVRKGRAASDRDAEIHDLTRALRMLERFGVDVCLGRMDRADDPTPVYVGRIGLTDRSDRQLLVDWRAPAAEPFFAATHADPRGLRSRRRYRWSDGRIVDYWDEVFADGGDGSTAALDDLSGFIAGLGSSRTTRMRDVLSTLAADQDAIVRAPARGALVVDGGPGTGKTVVALHRAAYLLYADPRLDRSRGSVLVVGPSRRYLAYVADVLPSLGEDGVRTCTFRDFVPEGEAAEHEPDPRVAGIKSSARMAEAVEPAVGLYEEPPAEPMSVETEWGDVRIDAADWVEAFESAGPGIPHNEARDEVWEALVEIVVERFVADDDDIPADEVRSGLMADDDLRDAFRGAWPILHAEDLVGDLWSVPAYLRRCAPWLTPDDVRLLQRPASSPWTVEDLPLLDAMRARLGDPGASARAQRLAASLTRQRDYMDDVVDYILRTDDDPDSTLPMLRGADLRQVLLDEDAVGDAGRDPLAGPFAHIVVDEAQELTDAQWQMLLRRCPSRSFTIVGDRAQTRHGFGPGARNRYAGDAMEPMATPRYRLPAWQDRLAPLGFRNVEVATLTINYRTPAEVMAEAAPVIHAVLPDVAVPTSIRESGIPVRHGRRDEVGAIVDEWLTTHEDGTVCVIGDPSFAERARVSVLTSEQAKGLEFDLVVLVDPAGLGGGIEGAVDRYVAMTRSTRELVVLDASRR
jgi:hypothetical protein